MVTLLPVAHQAFLVDALPTKRFQFVGGNLCLDFTNTVGGKRGVTTREFLNGYGDLLAWFEQAGLVNECEAKVMARDAAAEPAKAAGILRRAIELREAIYQIFFTVFERQPPSKTHLDVLNSELARVLGRLRLAVGPEGSGFGWACSPGTGLDAPLGPVARAAAELLTHEHLRQQVHQCGAENCGWLFLDSSKNHSRRWCDMRDCGNRAKVRRHRAKRQSG